MKLLNFSGLLTLLIVLFSCDMDFGTASVTYTRATAVYGDLDVLRSTPLVESIRQIDNPGKIFISNDLLLIGEEGKGVHLFDNSNPQSPAPLSFLNIPGNREFFVSGDLLFAESLYDMLKIDISDPQNPVLLTRLENSIFDPLLNDKDEAMIDFIYEEVTEEINVNSDKYYHLQEQPVHFYDFSNNMIPPSAVPTSFSGTSNSAIGSVNRIAYHRGFVFVVTRSVLSVYDSRGDFQQVFSSNEGWNMETVYPFQDRLYVGAQNSMQIFNISDPVNPFVTSTFFHETSCDPVYPVDGNTAYLTLRTGDFSECPGDVNELLILDTSRPERAESLKQFEMESPFGMTMIGDRLFVGEGESGFKVFDATDRRNLVLERWVKDISAYDIIAHPSNANMILIAGPDGFSQYQINDNLDLNLLSSIRF